MTGVPQQILRLATLLIGVSATSVALAVATVEVTTTGSIRDSTTLQLDNIVGDHRYVFDKNKTSISMPAGTYTARVMYMGLPSGEPHTVTVTDGVINRLEYDDSGNVKELPPAPIVKPAGPVLGTQPSEFSIYAGPGAVRRNGVSFGVNPATEQPEVQSPDKIYTAVVDMTWRLSSRIELSAGGMGGDRSNSAEVPIGQRTGVTFLNPQGLITGFVSNGGGQFSAKGKVFDLHLDSAFPARVLKDEKDSRWYLYILAGGRYSETKDHGTFNVLADQSIWSTTDLKMKEFDVHGGPELRGEHMFQNGLVGSLGVGANAIYYHASLDATQAFACPICSPAIRMVSGSASDTRNRLTFGATVSGGLSYPVSDKASILFRLSYDEIWNAPRVFNKISPNDPAPHLGTGNLGIGSVELGVSIKF